MHFSAIFVCSGLCGSNTGCPAECVSRPCEGRRVLGVALAAPIPEEAGKDWAGHCSDLRRSVWLPFRTVKGLLLFCSQCCGPACPVALWRRRGKNALCVLCVPSQAGPALIRRTQPLLFLWSVGQLHQALQAAPPSCRRCFRRAPPAAAAPPAPRLLCAVVSGSGDGMPP